MDTSPTQRYIDVTQEAGRAFISRGIEGRIVMLNLLRFRDVADYAATPDLAPPTPISGEQAYARYVEHVTPYLEESGSEVIFSGNGGPFLIGPSGEQWDRMLLVRHRSVQAFLAFAVSEGYLSGVGHRTAALEDSRLLPVLEEL